MFGVTHTLHFCCTAPICPPEQRALINNYTSLLKALMWPFCGSLRQPLPINLALEMQCMDYLGYSERPGGLRCKSL